MTSDGVGEARRVLRRCARCRLLFEVDESAVACIVCGEALWGLALPLATDPVPDAIVEREPTERLEYRKPENA
jgi:hypothetical protein